jgi:hypothetical protein
VPVPEVSAAVSLAVIAGVLAITAVTSLVTARHQAATGQAEQAEPAGQAEQAEPAGQAGLAGPVRVPRARRADAAGHPRSRP